MVVDTLTLSVWWMGRRKLKSSEPVKSKDLGSTEKGGKKMRNVFVSYAHRLDQDAADDFRQKFGSEGMVFSDRSLANQDLGGLKDETIKDCYIRPKIRQSSVTIVLIGSTTGGRWWVDWEIYYSMLKTTGNDRNGVLGIFIPYKEHNIPQRILDNLDYCELIAMPSTKAELEIAIEKAYAKRYNTPDLSRPLRQRNS